MEQLLAVIYIFVEQEGDELVVTNTGRLWFLLADHQHGDIGRQQSVTITITTIFPSQICPAELLCGQVTRIFPSQTSFY